MYKGEIMKLKIAILITSVLICAACSSSGSSTSSGSSDTSTDTAASIVMNMIKQPTKIHIM